MLISSFIFVSFLKEVIISSGAINSSMFIDIVPMINLVSTEAMFLSITAGIARSTKFSIKVGAACMYSSMPNIFKYEAKG
jgi:uncharacterized membrane protein YozB (DUF420 family)